MGWFWNDSTASGPAKDPFHRLNPDVREFLLRESPLKPAPAPAPAPTASTAAEPALSSPSQPTTPSKYGNRYADIWEQYRSPHAQEATRSAQEQLSDIIQAYKWRKGAIGRAALENCADQQTALYNCYQNGTVRERMTTCSAYNHKLQNCYMTQAKLLRTLGYMSDFTRAPEVDEKIQMYADKMYQEEEAAAAAASGSGSGSGSESPL
ncbi:hypothetical protein Q9L58_004981 [Maublancomyces gigas]|uniref:Uncharacterized protein n=1 Tax=Discina gigas TaxID=1032678 RepID=A0ABR3GJG6_9PEZI